MNASGDVQLEQEEWFLSVDEGRVVGHYEREVTTISGDSRPYRCNGELSFTRQTRYELEGQVSDNRLLIREVDFQVEPHRCESGNRVMDKYHGTVSSKGLLLRWSTGQQLLSRGNAGPVHLASAANGVAGGWIWKHRSVDFEGDRRVEQETWSIRQEGDAIRGHYESIVTFTSGDQRPFRCNGEMEYTNKARFQIDGRIRGQNVHIKETDYIVSEGPCETGMRRLGSYKGSLNGANLVLDWGSGRQTLHRQTQ